MARPAIEATPWDARWTGDELVESYEELAEIEKLAEAEKLVEGPGGGEAPEGDELGLVATLEARAGREAPRATESSPKAAGAPSADAETYEVLPVLEVLAGLADYGHPETARASTNEERSREVSLLG
ncbi:MAG TPA: hypothetical protein VLC54_11400 [Anaeromyxobacter sp.]|nr:hypothetical protein [Anaeromyxobacter sp.]